MIVLLMHANAVSELFQKPGDPFGPRHGETHESLLIFAKALGACCLRQRNVGVQDPRFAKWALAGCYFESNVASEADSVGAFLFPRLWRPTQTTAGSRETMPLLSSSQGFFAR